MAVKTEITACLKHNKIDNKSVVCRSLSWTSLLTKHQLARCFPKICLAQPWRGASRTGDGHLGSWALLIWEGLVFFSWPNLWVLSGRLLSPKRLSGLLPRWSERAAADKPPMPLGRAAHRRCFGCRVGNRWGKAWQGFSGMWLKTGGRGAEGTWAGTKEAAGERSWWGHCSRAQEVSAGPWQRLCQDCQGRERCQAQEVHCKEVAEKEFVRVGSTMLHKPNARTVLWCHPLTATVAGTDAVKKG